MSGPRPTGAAVRAATHCGIRPRRPTALREAVLDVARWRACRGGDPGAATRRVVSLDSDGDVLTVDGRLRRWTARGRVVVVGAGKASLRSPPRWTRCWATGSTAGWSSSPRGPRPARPRPGRGPATPTTRCPPSAASPPPRRSSRAPAAAGPTTSCSLLHRRQLGAREPARPTASRIEDKRELHRLLLRSGAAHHRDQRRAQARVARQGRPARASPRRPRAIVNLTVSDVAGDPLDAITDPTVQDTSTAPSALAVLDRAGLWDAVPASIRAHLGGGRDVAALDRTRTRDRCAGRRRDRLRGDGGRARRAGLPPGRRPERASRASAARSADRCAGVRSQTAGADAAADDAARLRRRVRRHADAAPHLRRGRPEPGGRARRRARLLGGRPAAAVFLDTDGSDGGTDARRRAGRRHDRRRAAAARRRPRRRDRAPTARPRRCERLGDAIATGAHRHQRERPVRDRRDQGGPAVTSRGTRVRDRRSTHVTKSFGGVDRGRRRRHHDRRRRVLLAARPERAAARRRRCGLSPASSSPTAGRDPARRRPTSPTGHRPSDPEHGVPGLRAVPAHDRRGQRRASACGSSG